MDIGSGAAHPVHPLLRHSGVDMEEIVRLHFIEFNLIDSLFSIFAMVLNYFVNYFTVCSLCCFLPCQSNF